MAADFGEAKLVVTKRMKQQLLVYEKAENPEYYYYFEKKSTKRLANGNENTYFICRGCKVGNIANGGDDHRTARITVPRWDKRHKVCDVIA